MGLLYFKTLTVEVTENAEKTATSSDWGWTL